MPRDITVPLRATLGVNRVPAVCLVSNQDLVTILVPERVLPYMQKPMPCFTAIVRICTELPSI